MTAKPEFQDKSISGISQISKIIEETKEYSFIKMKDQSNLEGSFNLSKVICPRFKYPYRYFTHFSVNKPIHLIPS